MRYVAVAPDGTRITRGTNRTYSHAVLVGPCADHPSWGAWSFAGSLSLARQAEVRALRVWRGRAEVLVVPVFEDDLADCPYCAPDEKCSRCGNY